MEDKKVIKKYLFIKRGLDIVMALILFFILSPIIVLTAIALKIEDAGSPVFFIQKRPGKDEKIFKIFKFRSMILETEKNGRKLSDKERLTKVGRIIRKTSVDELPQLLNIIKGEMSFIGPRPLLVEYLTYYTEKEKMRHSIRPGITGLVQVSGRNSLDWDERLKKDIEYVKQISFPLDLKIAILTIIKIIKGSDVAEDTNLVEGNFAEIRSK
jgi:undecaprenyl phosphate N,N'-diacetylbacillosamine 1-phosphate transferase